MATTLTVDIVTPERSVFQGEAIEVLLPGAEGEFDVLPEHDDFLALLKPGLAQVRTATGLFPFVLGAGFAEAGGDHVTVLADSATAADAIDLAAAQSELAFVQAELNKPDLTPEAAVPLRSRELLARALILAAGKH